MEEENRPNLPTMSPSLCACRDLFSCGIHLRTAHPSHSTKEPPNTALTLFCSCSLPMGCAWGWAGMQEGSL